MVFIDVKPKHSYIRFGAHGNITIASELLKERFLKNKFKHVKILVDSENKIIGLQPTNNSESGYKLQKAGGACRITCGALRNMITLPKKEYIPTWDNKRKMLIINYGDGSGK